MLNHGVETGPLRTNETGLRRVAPGSNMACSLPFKKAGWGWV
jgi:hypothetical protein